MDCRTEFRIFRLIMVIFSPLSGDFSGAFSIFPNVSPLALRFLFLYPSPGDLDTITLTS
jgi:hypothetical protein